MENRKFQLAIQAKQPETTSDWEKIALSLGEGKGVEDCKKVGERACETRRVLYRFRVISRLLFF